MSIAKSYNHKTGTYYAYETTYEWSDEKQKKVPVRKCIGHFDPVTGEIVPNGKRGKRPVYPRDESDTSESLDQRAEKHQSLTNDDYEFVTSMFKKLADICEDAVTHFAGKAETVNR